MWRRGRAIGGACIYMLYSEREGERWRSLGFPKGTSKRRMHMYMYVYTRMYMQVPPLSRPRRHAHFFPARLVPRPCDMAPKPKAPTASRSRTPRRQGQEGSRLRAAANAKADLPGAQALQQSSPSGEAPTLAAGGADAATAAVEVTSEVGAVEAAAGADAATADVEVTSEVEEEQAAAGAGAATSHVEVPGVDQSQSLMQAGVFEETKALAHGPLDYKRCAALRMKYRIAAPDGSGKHRQPPNWVGHHMKNRDGTRMSADRCEELLEGMIGQFDTDEADHDSVSVAQAPGTKDITEWTQSTCDADPIMASVVEHLLQDGSIGHTHLNQVLHNVSAGAKVTRPGLKRYANANGCLSLTLVREKDAELADYAVRGLSWERLHSAIAVEEPGGIVLIMSLFNRKRDMQMVEHEMQVLSRLANIVLDFSRLVGTEISIEMARDKLAAEGMPQEAHSADFLGVLNAVLQWGGAESIHFKRLKEFHNQCVNAKLRRVRMSVITALAGIDLKFPLTRNLGLEFAYSASAEKNQIEDGFCNKIKVSNVYFIRQPGRQCVLEAMEQCLDIFHNQYRGAGAYKALAPGDLTKLLCKVDLMMAPPLFFERSIEGAQKQIKVCSEKVSAAIRASLPKGMAQLLDATFGTVARASEPEAALMPKVGTYDEQGRAQNKQDESVTGNCQTSWDSFPFVDSLRNAEDLTLKVRFLHALAIAHGDLGVTLNLDVDLKRECLRESTQHGKGTQILTKRDFLTGELCLLPLVKGIEYLVAAKSSLSPLTVETSLLTRDGSALSIIPCVMWAEKQPFLLPFWLGERSKDTDEVNAEIAKMTVSLVGECKMARASGPEALTSERTMQRFDVRVPCMRNTRTLEAGAELVIAAKKERKVAKAAGSSRTWLEVANKQERKKQ